MMPQCHPHKPPQEKSIQTHPSASAIPTLLVLENPLLCTSRCALPTCNPNTLAVALSLAYRHLNRAAALGALCAISPLPEAVAAAVPAAARAALILARTALVVRGRELDVDAKGVGRPILSACETPDACP